MRMFPGLFLLALMSQGCGGHDAADNKLREQDERTAQEIRDVADATTTKNAPLIAARHNLSIAQVKRILLLNRDEESRAFNRVVANPTSRMADLVPDNASALDAIADQEHLERRVVGDVLFDNAVLICADKGNVDQ